MYMLCSNEPGMAVVTVCPGGGILSEPGGYTTLARDRMTRTCDAGDRRSRAWRRLAPGRRKRLMI